MNNRNNDVVTLDLYCLECGYNLRGQSGDPRRCSECGHHNSVEDLEVPAKLIRRALRQLESGAALCGASASTLLLLVVPLFDCYGPTKVAATIVCLGNCVGSRHRNNDLLRCRNVSLSAFLRKQISLAPHTTLVYSHRLPDFCSRFSCNRIGLVVSCDCGCHATSVPDQPADRCEDSNCNRDACYIHLALPCCQAGDSSLTTRNRREIRTSPL